MFQPNYQVSPQLLRTIKRIAILVHDLNRLQLTDLQQAQLLSEARVTSTYASTSIEGNPLPLSLLIHEQSNNTPTSSACL